MSTAATSTTPATNGATASSSLNNTLRSVSFLNEDPTTKKSNKTPIVVQRDSFDNDFGSFHYKIQT